MPGQTKRLRDAGPRPRKGPTTITRSQRAKKQLKAIRAKETPGYITLPAETIAYQIRRALNPHPVPDILVYDGEGKLLRRLDGLTKKEKPL